MSDNHLKFTLDELADEVVEQQMATFKEALMRKPEDWEIPQLADTVEPKQEFGSRVFANHEPTTVRVFEDHACFVYDPKRGWTCHVPKDAKQWAESVKEVFHTIIKYDESGKDEQK